MAAIALRHPRFYQSVFWCPQLTPSVNAFSNVNYSTEYFQLHFAVNVFNWQPSVRLQTWVRCSVESAPYVVIYTCQQSKSNIHLFSCVILELFGAKSSPVSIHSDKLCTTVIFNFDRARNPHKSRIVYNILGNVRKIIHTLMISIHYFYVVQNRL